MWALNLHLYQPCDFPVTECDTPRSVEEEEEASDLDGPVEKEKKPVEKAVVAAGMKRLTFLIDSCNPGMVPDPEFLAAALDLVSVCLFVMLSVCMSL